MLDDPRAEQHARDIEELPLGSLVRYYEEGWRHGYLEEVKKGSVRIRPIVSKHTTNLPRCSRVPVSFVEVARVELRPTFVAVTEPEQALSLDYELVVAPVSVAAPVPAREVKRRATRSDKGKARKKVQKNY